MPPLTAQQIADVSLELLIRTLVLPMTATRVPGTNFSGPNGATVTVRLRVPRTARTQDTPGAAITFDALNEIAVPVAVSHLYDAANLTDEDLSLALEDFADQVTEPQVGSVAMGAEDEIAAAMNGLTAAASFDLAASEADTRTKILTARAELTKNKVPLTGRFFACSPDIATRVLLLPEIVQADKRGDGGSALADAIIGRAYGFTFVESAGLTDGEAVAYHRSGFAFATRTPVPPSGVDSSAVTREGVGMRQIRQYNPSTLSEQSVVSTYAGCTAVAEDGATATVFDRQYKLDTAIS